ncbi:MAG: ribonuclease H family protein [Anaerolineae bacterium]|nr:ribonuclease H family protein [Anaerolineae bacterium]
MPKAKKFYVVWKGRKIGIFDTWAECEAQIKGFAGTQYMAFETKEAAEQAFRDTYEEARRPANTPKLLAAEILQAVGESYSVDAACSGNPGVLEYRCVHNPTGEEVFRRGPYQDGTNNVGEFLAIVEALMLFKKQVITAPLYSDSNTAIGWVKGGKCRTTLERTKNNAELFRLIDEAETWLHENEYTTSILKWETDKRGQIPADYGRK